jgi:hypothetical protein
MDDRKNEYLKMGIGFMLFAIFLLGGGISKVGGFDTLVNEVDINKISVFNLMYFVLSIVFSVVSLYYIFVKRRENKKC